MARNTHTHTHLGFYSEAYRVDFRFTVAAVSGSGYIVEIFELCYVRSRAGWRDVSGWRHATWHTWLVPPTAGDPRLPPPCVQSCQSQPRSELTALLHLPLHLRRCRIPPAVLHCLEVSSAPRARPRCSSWVDKDGSGKRRRQRRPMLVACDAHADPLHPPGPRAHRALVGASNSFGCEPPRTPWLPYYVYPLSCVYLYRFLFSRRRQD